MAAIQQFLDASFDLQLLLVHAQQYADFLLKLYCILAFFLHHHIFRGTKTELQLIFFDVFSFQFQSIEGQQRCHCAGGRRERNSNINSKLKCCIVSIFAFVSFSHKFFVFLKPFPNLMYLMPTIRFFLFSDSW